MALLKKKDSKSIGIFSERTIKIKKLYIDIVYPVASKDWSWMFIIKTFTIKNIKNIDNNFFNCVCIGDRLVRKWNSLRLDAVFGAVSIGKCVG